MHTEAVWKLLKDIRSEVNGRAEVRMELGRKDSLIIFLKYTKGVDNFPLGYSAEFSTEEIEGDMDILGVFLESVPWEQIRGEHNAAV